MNLKINVKNISSVAKRLTIDVPTEIVSKEFESFYEAIRKRVRIPGFRLGQAPPRVVALHYKDKARSEVLQELLTQSLRNAVEQEDISLIGYPKVENIDFEEFRLRFDALVETRPKVKVDKYIGLSIKREAVVTSDKDVDEAMKRLQETRAKFTAVESRPAQLGDFMICDYSLVVEGKEIEKHEGEWIELKTDDYLENFSKQLVGVQTNEERRVEVSFPKDYANKEFIGKQGCFLVTVKEIKARELPPLDDEFAKDVGEEQTLANLRESIRKDIEKNKKDQSEHQVDQALLDELLKKSKFEVPRGIVDDRLKSLVDERIQTLMYRGISEDEAEKQRGLLTKSLDPDAERDVRISFILDEIQKREKIEVLNEDLEERYRRVAERFKRPIDEIKLFYEKDERRQDSLKSQIEHEKTLQWVKSRAKIKEKK
jgi:trigger factor